jgi:2-oxoglutarate dehydrogenase E1 component
MAEAESVLEAFRRWGYLQADLDPLGRLSGKPHPALDRQGAEADRARALYCGPIGAEFLHIPDPERCDWVARQMEAPAPEIDRHRLLERILQAEAFEQLLQTRYIGTKRYSLEGAAALIPLLDAILEVAAGNGTAKALIGMSHRGRISVMVQVVGKTPAEIFAGFEDVDAKSVLGGGDVKYHIGATGEWRSSGGRTIALSLVSNPSHLEAIDPVVAGRSRAWQDRLGPEGRARVLPLVLHGDGAVAGQGIAAETFNMAELPGYGVGGTVHVIVNNLIGFTTNPAALHSSPFASDVAKRLPVPVFHVNGEDPEAVVRAARIAAGYRYRFGSDAVVDLVGYRRYGHSEVDDPTITQPLLYRKIHDRPPLWEIYAKRIGASPEETEKITASLRRMFDEDYDAAKKMTSQPALRQLPDYWEPYTGGAYVAAAEVDTGAAPGRLAEVARALTSVPEAFAVHPKVKRLLDERRAMAEGKRPVDWGTAELLAYGCLLADGVPVRLSGEDTRRGTFNQRHAVLIDVETEAEHAPLAHVSPGQARFECWDSPLSEAAVLGFEFGYSRDAPEALVLWEAQFGDFANGAQVIIDQFVAATEDKWKLLSGIVLLLPHGYEGQGPEHSSARLERFLQLAAEDNIQVCQPSSSAQYFHLLRRQAMRRWRKPLVVMTPKSLLRNPSAGSPIGAFSAPRFLEVLPDAEAPRASRILVCTGKIAHELKTERARRQSSSVAVVTVEQLYPFPEAGLAEALHALPEGREIVWIQEEPANMGALSWILPRLEAVSGGRPVRSIKRSPSASPATGSLKASGMEQAALLALAFA